MRGHPNHQARPISRLRWAGALAFLAGVAALFAGAAFKASGTGLLVLLYASLSLVTVAVLLFGIDWLHRLITKRTSNDEHERIAGR